MKRASLSFWLGSTSLVRRIWSLSSSLGVARGRRPLAAPLPVRAAADGSRSGSTTPTGWCRSGRRSSRGPGVVGAASNFIVPPQLRAKGAKTVYFDLYLNNRVGTPSKPADPSTIQARADKLFDTRGHVVGLRPPADRRERALRRADCRRRGRRRPRSTARTCSRYLQRLAERGARPFLLLSNRPYTHDEAADDWWRRRRQGRRPRPGGLLLAARRSRKQGAVAGSRRLRATMRTRMEDLIQIGIPTNRLGMMLHLQLDAARRRPRGPAAAREVARRRQVGGARGEAGRRASCTSRRLVVGLGGVQPGRATTRTSRSSRARGSGRATTRSATRRRSPARSSTSRSTSARRCRRARSACSGRRGCSRPTSPR